MLTASIVVYHTAEEELHRCLQSLLACEALRHVYVVDNGSEERLRQFCARQGERVSYRALPNVGYGAGHNSALREVVEEKIDAPRYHLVINSDVYFAPGTLERIVEHMEGHPEVGQLIPKVYYPDGRLQHVCRMLPTPADLWLRRFMPRWMSRRRMERYTLAFTGYLGLHHNVNHFEPVIVPFLDAPEVSGPALVVDDEGHSTVGQTFFEHNQSAHTTISVFEGEDLLEPHMEVKDLIPLNFGLVLIVSDQLCQTGIDPTHR